VNTAARLEALTKTHVDAEADVLLTEETAHRLGSTGLVTRSLGTVPIRGRDRPVGIHVLERAT
jgi:class 3 adenylate cyclase